MDVTLRTTDAATIIPLRHAILRPGLPATASHFDADGDATTAHFGAFTGNKLLGCVTVHPEPLILDDVADQPGWRLRGMAVADAAQGLGVGRKLVDAVCRHVVAQTGTPELIWCNARATALGFYERCGWTIVSDVFDIAGVGPHRKMAWRP